MAACGCFTTTLSGSKWLSNPSSIGQVGYQSYKSGYNDVPRGSSNKESRLLGTTEFKTLTTIGWKVGGYSPLGIGAPTGTGTGKVFPPQRGMGRGRGWRCPAGTGTGDAPPVPDPPPACVVSVTASAASVTFTACVASAAWFLLLLSVSVLVAVRLRVLGGQPRLPPPWVSAVLGARWSAVVHVAEENYSLLRIFHPLNQQFKFKLVV
ncbi:hypothetical protein Cgig2_011906 [Carnegiea gigantea]|uniref:Uncharacterized protein n=1 Tax=Carnegiea gigantea TaxID=171969 RepID=A0A9Q1GW43_9CARY|nr:hypothetical protein Cgig2_011906 [Carnegiea gigantea]